MSPDIYSVQATFVPLLLGTILKMLQKGDMDDLLEYLDDMNITNEMIKEHLLTLALDDGFAPRFDKIDPKVKAAFTRAYNK